MNKKADIVDVIPKLVLYATLIVIFLLIAYLLTQNLFNIDLGKRFSLG